MVAMKPISVCSASSSFSWSAAISVFCVALYCVGFVRLELKIHEHEKRLYSVEHEAYRSSRETEDKNIKPAQTVNVAVSEPKMPHPTIPQLRYRRAANAYAGSLTPQIKKEINRSVDVATRKICTSKGKLCLRGPPGLAGSPGKAGPQGNRGRRGIAGTPGSPGSVGPPGVSGEKGAPGKPGGPTWPVVKVGRGGAITAPGIRVSPSALTIKENQTAVFHCDATGGDRADVRWSRIGGNSLPPGRSSTVKGKLEIRKSDIDDNGKYVCTVKSSGGVAQAVVTLDIQASPRITLAPGPVYTNNGNTVTLPRCNAAGFPAPVVTWSKLFDRLPQKKVVLKDQTLTIVKPNKIDSGTYICTASNNLGTARAGIQVIVNVVPQFVKKPPAKMEVFLGQDAIINCSATGDPAPKVTWKRCKGDIPRHRSKIANGSLTVRHVTADDSDVYICVAASPPVKVEAQVDLKVKIARDCSVLLSAGFKTSGVYTIDPDGWGKFDVFCDMQTDGGGWTVFHKRNTGYTSFYRNWNEYKAGFGDLVREFWLGNDNIHRLTASFTALLRVDVVNLKGEKKFAKYSSFTVSDESANYQLNSGTYSGNAGNQMNYHNGMAFTTYDKQNDRYTENCAVKYHGAWWYKSCHYSNLNGRYKENNQWSGNVRASEMKLRPK